MNTLITKLDPENIDNTVIEKAAEIIASGGLVAFPTETVYGLGADAERADVAEKIYKAKGRPSDNPLIIHIAKAEDAEKYAYTNELYYKLTDAFSPGPLTVILPKKNTVPDTVTGGLDTVAIRIPSNKIARALIERAGVAIAAPSANTSGKPSPTEAAHVIEDLSGKADMIIDGGSSEIGLESTVVKVDESSILLLRPGAVDVEMLRAVCENVTVSSAILEKLKAGEKAESPGMMYKHYAPDIPVYLVEGEESNVVEFFRKKRSPIKQANVLFAYLRDYNSSTASEVYSVIPDSDGVGLAVLNRLMRAAGFQIIKV